MSKYLGQFPVALADTPYANYTQTDWAMKFIESYGQFDGAHHKQWTLDQVARIHKGTPVIVELAKWEEQEEYRFWLGEPTQEYLDWVIAMKGDYIKTESYEYDYEEGIAP